MSSVAPPSSPPRPPSSTGQASPHIQLSMPDSLEYLEYEEESAGDDDDLFGSDKEDDLPSYFANADTRVPIAPPAVDSQRAEAAAGKRSPTPQASSAAAPKPPADGNDEPHVTPDQRMKQLVAMRAPPEPTPPQHGVRSLKALCNMVVRENSMRIWDIGGTPYSLVASFIDQCPRDQLAEIEEASPHICKETDWLWEYFVIAEYPLFYQQCRLRHGKPRTSGWRRMFEKAIVDAEERRTQAMEKLANRYKQLERERASKRIVVMDAVIAEKKRGWGGSSHSLSTARRGVTGIGATGSQNRMQTAMSKARTDSQRARVALTHASGKFIPPTPSGSRRAPPVGDGDLYRNPYNASSSSSANHGRIPAPRIPHPMTANVSPAPRAPVPAASVLPPQPVRSEPLNSEERFRIDPNRRRELHTIHKPKVSNFETRKPIDFFGTSSRMGTSSAPASPGPKRPAPPVMGQEPKRSRLESANESPKERPHSSQPSPRPSPSSQPPSRSQTPGGGPPRPPPPQKDLASVLFMKKRKPSSRR